MNFARFFVLGVLLISSAAWAVTAYSFPAVSVQHLLTDKDCEIVPDLQGEWEADGDLSGTWVMQKFGDRKYRLIEKDGESSNANKAAFDICVAHLGGRLFFDATSQKMRPDNTTAVFNEEEDFWIPLHLFGRLEVKEDGLDFLLLDDGWLQDELKSGRLRLTCSQDDEGYYLLTAPSKELKEFATRFATDPRPFSYKEAFERMRYLISADGLTIQDKRQLHNAILDYKDPAKTKEGKDRGRVTTSQIQLRNCLEKGVRSQKGTVFKKIVPS